MIMRKILFAWLLCGALHASAQDYTYSTNLYAGITTPALIFCGTNSTDAARDTYIMIWNKLNSDITLLWNDLGSASGGGSVSATFTNTLTLPDGTAPYITNYGGLVGVYQLAEPQSRTNLFQSSQQLTLFSTNYATWGTSNYIGTFSQVAYYTFNSGMGGGGGLVIPTNVFGQVTGCTNGVNWFVLPASFSCLVPIQIAVVGAGGGMGDLTIYGVDHPEAVGRTNGLFGQSFQTSDPVNPQDVATKNYVDTSIANATASNFHTWSDSNGVHYAYSQAGTTLMDLVSTFQWIAINHAARDSTKTNIAIQVYQTNLLAGWLLQGSTNLLLTNGWSSVTSANYTASTNSGVVTFLVPMYTAPMQWFRAIVAPSISINAYAPMAAFAGVYYPPNTFSLYNITNGRADGGWWMGDSNTLALVLVHWKGGVVTITNAAPR
jgi:hypothetical protein